MQYDPIKKSLGQIFNKTPFLRILFYKLLDLLLLRTWHVKKEIRIWSRNHKGKQHILDAGSGFGQYTFFMSGKNKNWSVEAVDVKEEQIADCTTFFSRINRTNVVFGIADLTTYHKPGTFDMILSVDVMEHIEEDERVFRNFYDSLTPGGMLLISTPSDQGGSDVHDHGEEASFIDEHVRDGYNITEIQEKLKRAGFTRTEARYAYGKPGQTGWRLSMKYPIQMLNASKLFFILLPFYYILTFPFALIFNWMDLAGSHTTGTGLIVKAYK
ncbi:MAG: class I SAM-dependent methyltransferase [Bacteroidetes bacterium]|nr:class I SAM-dependent methyltransferase [Bacteroidota bacterium]